MQPKLNLSTMVGKFIFFLTVVNIEVRSGHDLRMKSGLYWTKKKTKTENSERKKI